MPGSTTRPLWNVPYQRNPFFTGREDTLSRLDRALHAEYRVALSQPQSLTGLGGIGKTQTVVEYAYRHREKYDAVLWVRADSVTALTSSMIELAQVLELPERNEQDQEMIVQAVLRWLRLHSTWLLIYDNIEDLSIAEQFLPKAGAGHLLFTTRTHALGGLAQRLEVQQMEPEVGALLLLRRASLLALQAALNMADPDEQRLAQALSQELDGLPLALDQAGAYIKETPCSLSDYRTLYQARRSDLLGVRGSFDQDYPPSVATTWSLSFEKIGQANPAAAELLNFCAFLAPDAIPEDLLTAGSSHLGPILASVVTDPLQFDQVCKEVLRFSLIQRGADECTLTMHRLVQAVLRETLPPERQHQWMKRAIYAVDATYSEDQTYHDVAHWHDPERFLPHALTCAAWIEQAQFAMFEALRLLDRTGGYLFARGRYGEVEPLLQRSLAISRQTLGESDLHTTGVLTGLASLYRVQGRYEEAGPLLQQVLTIYTQTLGANSSAVAITLNQLALLYKEQGNYKDAESLFQRALAVYQALDANHPLTLQSLNNLALLYNAQGRYGEAEPLFQRTLAVREQVLGPTHPDTANSLISLAECYRAQGKYHDIEPFYQRTLTICDQVLGPTHPHTASSLNCLAGLYQVQGRYEEAEKLYQRTLAIREQALGPTHPDTATSLNNLALLYATQGKYGEAEPLYRRVLAIREQALGSTHPDTATSLNNLAELYTNQKRYKEAEQMHQQALTIRKQALGPIHSRTAHSLNNLAGLYRVQGKYKEAEPLFQQALAICEQALGPTHPDTATCLDNLMELYVVQGKLREAELLYQRALTMGEHVLGHAHPTTQTIRKKYILLLRAMGRQADAKQLEDNF